MKTRYGFLDPGAIMGVVVSLILLGIGVFAFFTVSGSISLQTPRSTTTWGDGTYNMTQNYTGNTTKVGDSVFNIIGIVLIIGAIMSIVAMVYNYVR